MAKSATSKVAKQRDGARERVLATSYELFRLQGTRGVGIDTIVKRSGVAKMSLYRHFRSKEELIAAFLRRREELWTMDWLAAEIRRRAKSPSGRLLAIFDVFGEWFRSDTFDDCSFINVLLEYPAGHRSPRTAGRHLANIRVDQGLGDRGWHRRCKPLRRRASSSNQGCPQIRRANIADRCNCSALQVMTALSRQ